MLKTARSTILHSLPELWITDEAPFLSMLSHRNQSSRQSSRGNRPISRMTWNIERDLTAKNWILGWMVIFAANLTLFQALTAWICIQREEFGNFTIFCRIFCWLVEIYYWLLQNQCSESIWSHIYRFILVYFKCEEITINRFEFTVACSILYRSIIPIWGCKFMVCIHYE